VRRLVGPGTLVASVITYAELLTGARLGHHDHAGVRGFFEQLIDEIHGVDRPAAERAAELRAANLPLKMPDALILATADLHQVDVIVTGDDRWAGVIVSPQVELLDAG